jgi:hypothetical protein
VLTFDDGFKTDYEVAWPILKQYGFPATLFVYTDWVGKAVGADTWPMLKEMLAGGLIDVQSHTVTHANLVATARRHDNGARLTKELQQSKRVLAEQLGRPCTIIAYPYGATNDAVRQATQEAGYTAGLSVDGTPVASGDGLLQLGRRMVFRKDSLETFAKQRVAPRKLLLTATSPASGSKVAEAKPTLSCTLPADVKPTNLVLRLDGQALPHQFDPATGTVTAVSPALPAKTHRVALSVVADGLELFTSWSFAVAPRS